MTNLVQQASNETQENTAELRMQFQALGKEQESELTKSALRNMLKGKTCYVRIAFAEVDLKTTQSEILYLFDHIDHDEYELVVSDYNDLGQVYVHVAHKC